MNDIPEDWDATPIHMFKKRRHPMSKAERAGKAQFQSLVGRQHIKITLPEFPDASKEGDISGNS